LTVNYKTAEKIDLSLKYSLIASTSFVGDSKEIVADKIYNLQSIMQEAIVKNLQLKAEEKDILINEKDVEKANSDYLPNLKMNVSGNYIDQDLAKISNGQKS
jgi:outer membrane protein TolC